VGASRPVQRAPGWYRGGTVSPAGGGARDGIGDAVVSVVRAAVGAAGQAGRATVDTLSEAVESPSRAVARRVTAGALAVPRPVGEPEALATALARQPRAPALGGATGAAFAARVARRIGPLRFLARRTPMWLIVAAAPAVHASVTRGAEELGLVASHLVLRARQAGVQPDPDRLRRAAVQVVCRVPVDPEVEPHHARLALGWIERAVRAALPLSSGVATADPGGIAAAAAAVPASTLTAPPA